MKKVDINDIALARGLDEARRVVDETPDTSKKEPSPEADAKPNGTASRKKRTRRQAGEADKPKQGRALDQTDPEPWPHPVDGRELLEELAADIRSYVVLSETDAHTCAAWVLHAHVFEVFDITPRLLIGSPVPECGKTTLLEWFGTVSPRVVEAANVTSAAMFRLIEATRPTFLIDETDTFMPRNEELRGVVNSGHRRNGAVVRTVGEDHEPRNFSTWCPCVIAGIGRMPATIMSRSIVISLKRKKAGETVRRIRVSRIDDRLLRRCRRWALDSKAGLNVDPHVPDEIYNRELDNWLPLFSVAEAVGGLWPGRIRKAALTASGAVDKDISLSVQLLADARDSFAARDVDRLASESLIADLILDQHKPWFEYGRERKPITQRQLADLLRPFGIIPGTIRTSGDRTAKGYRLDQFEDAFDRYLGANE